MTGEIGDDLLDDEAVEEATLAVDPAAVGQRLDRVVAAVREDLSRSHIQQLIESGHITVNGVLVKPSHKARAGDTIILRLPPPAPTDLQPEPIPLTIIHEDERLLVIDKPAGLVTHPAPGHPVGTLVNAVLAHVPTMTMNGTLRPGIVHRLDKDTSGLIVVARDDAARVALVEQFTSRTVLKEYLALVHAHPASPATIDVPIGRDPRNRQRMAVVPTGRPARTEIVVEEMLAGYSLVRARLLTGRTHQIRVHLSYIGHPIVGDPLYGWRGGGEARVTIGGGQRRLPLERQFLHATRLGLRLPGSGEWREFTSSLPPELENVLAFLRQAEDEA